MQFDDNLEITRALAIYAHPDDAEFGISGTVAKWVKAGVEVTYAMVTNGGSGSNDPTMTREKLTSIRRDEQLAAAEVLGVANVEFLGFEDGYLEVNEASRKAVTRVVRKHRPDVILGMDPTIRFRDGYVNHPDHIAAGELVLRAVNPDASTRLMFPDLAESEGLEPWKPKAVFLMSWSPDSPHIEDISDTIDIKIQALGCHPSQIGDWPYEEFVREYSGKIGERSGYAAAEGFTILRLGE